MTRANHRQLHIVCCLKVVPRPEEVTVDAATKTLDRAHARSVINPPDMNVLEMALEIKDLRGGQVSLLSMGPPLFEEYLRLGLAMGADRAYLLSDRAFGRADTLATSYTLAQGIRRIADEGGYDLVLCGEESSDGATAQVPPGIAEWLGVPQITYAGEIALEDGHLRAVREVKGGHEVLEAPLPAVVSVRVGVNEPRFIDFDRKLWADTEAPVTVWAAADLDVDGEAIGLAGSPTTVSGLGEARSVERRRELIRGTPQEKAHALVERLRPFLGPSA
jgi:electron transfer flavoprotein beta subunit